jgi:hypothetical protein
VNSAQRPRRAQPSPAGLSSFPDSVRTGDARGRAHCGNVVRPGRGGQRASHARLLTARLPRTRSHRPMCHPPQPARAAARDTAAARLHRRTRQATSQVEAQGRRMHRPLPRPGMRHAHPPHPPRPTVGPRPHTRPHELDRTRARHLQPSSRRTSSTRRLSMGDQVGRGSDDEYCSAYPSEPHAWVSHSVRAAPIRWVERCHLCGHISSAALRAQLAPHAE